MGISTIILVPSLAVFGGFLAVKDAAPSLVRWLLLQASAVGFAAAICAHPSVNFTGLFGKSCEGAFPVWSHLLFYPYLYPLRAYVRLRRLKSREPVFTDIGDGLYVGGWPCDASQLPPGNPAVVDCTCELPRLPSVGNLPYLNIQVWDSRGPRPEEIELAVRWCSQKRRQHRSVFIHCAFGHGRSVTVMCALLVALGKFDTWQDAANFLKNLRPRIRLNRGQIDSLVKWTKFRESRARPSGGSVSPGPRPQSMRADTLSALDVYEF